MYLFYTLKEYSLTSYIDVLIITMIAEINITSYNMWFGNNVLTINTDRKNIVFFSDGTL